MHLNTQWSTTLDPWHLLNTPVLLKFLLFIIFLGITTTRTDEKALAKMQAKKGREDPSDSGINEDSTTLEILYRFSSLFGSNRFGNCPAKIAKCWEMKREKIRRHQH
jgi:hypothetical protein